jgi:periplasmic protein TonB
MADRRFLTDVPEESATRSHSSVSALAISLLVHATLFTVLAITVFRAAVANDRQEPPPIAAHIVYSHDAGGGRGPQGGDHTPAPRRMAETVGTRPLVAPAVRPAPQPDTAPREIAPEPLPSISAVAPLVDVGVREAVGTMVDYRATGAGGPGSGPGPGNGGPGCCGGTGDKIGSGDGDGVEPGKDVSWPRLVREVKPNYTAEAMRAQIEGLVELDIVVLPDGSVGDVRIKRSLDSRFGLDLEAIKAVRLWRFDPSRRAGKAVASRVGVELSFTLR